MKQKKIILPFLLALLIFTPLSAQAFDITVPNTITQPVTNSQAASQGVGSMISNVITLIFSFSGVAVVLYFLWGAFDWIMSGGDKEKVGNARKKMTTAIIGLLLLSLTFAIMGIISQLTSVNILGDLTLPRFGANN
jgi:hypothetical protein